MAWKNTRINFVKYAHMTAVNEAPRGRSCPNLKAIQYPLDLTLLQYSADSIT